MTVRLHTTHQAEGIQDGIDETLANIQRLAGSSGELTPASARRSRSTFTDMHNVAMDRDRSVISAVTADGRQQPGRRAPSQAGTSASGTRSCVMESRSRTVTASSSSVSKSTVTQYGVPISSWRR